MKRFAIVEVVLFAALLIAGVGSRLWLQHLPNFAPISAIALFAGYFFRSWLVAASLPIMIMGLSDHFIGGYDGRMMVLVHASLALPVLYRGALRRRFPVANGQATGDGQATARFFAAIFGTSLAASCVFFLVTNFGAWMWFDMYESTLPGLADCYIKALPFFRPTLAGDLVFTAALFGGYHVAVARGMISERSVTAPATSTP